MYTNEELNAVIPFGYLTTEEAGRELGKSVAELTALRDQGKGPSYVAIVGNVVRYNPEVIEAYKAAWADLEALELIGF
jgi:hypothetical protein